MSQGNRGPATRRAHKRCANPSCRAFFRPDRPVRQFCCLQCSADGRPRHSRVLSGRKGGRISGDRLRTASRARLQQSVAGLSPMQAFELGRKQRKSDINTLVATARREGFAEGYEAAIQAMSQMEKSA